MTKHVFSFRRTALLPTLVVLLAITSLSVRATDFNTGWQFIRGDESGAQDSDYDDQAWESVTLPHTARVEALVTGGENNHWQGLCWYRKHFDLPAAAVEKLVILRFEGAMNVADVWVNSERVGEFKGGYLPYVMDISQFVKPGDSNVIAVRLDNRDNPITGPKPLKDLDFNLYGGVYRPVHLIIKDKLHISDPILADKVGGGGIFVTFPEVSKESATVRVQTHVRNASDASRTYSLKTSLLDSDGQVVAVETHADPGPLLPDTDRTVVQSMHVVNPSLWSPNTPALYQVRSELIEEDAVVDRELTRIGIRRIKLSRDGFWINGEKMFLRGANRHQEYPYVGNALSDAAQFRDALKIKQAGFDYVRLSHYPQSPAFMDACDELGLVVMDCLMGWQYFNKDPAFAELKYRECRQLIRRDRNHACVILWEVSLNESRMPDEFIRKTQRIAHEEYPGDQCYSCGWTEGYDVFLQARQHGGCRGVTNQACVVSEYGDWEYYAQNAGLKQHEWKDLQAAERSSRQLRGDGEVRLLQQALNFQEAHNDNLQTTAFADGIWVMYDYNRGYAHDIEASGVMDIFRLPKFGYWFFRSQRDPDELVMGQPVGAELFIANYWMPNSPLEIRVFSNCDEVALYLNDALVERRGPDTTRLSTHVKHPPFTFRVDQFKPGTLRAVGYWKGQQEAEHTRRTPGEPAQLALRFDLSQRSFGKSGKDLVFCHADVQDATGTTVPAVEAPVFYGVTGGLRSVGHNPIVSEAGTATLLVEGESAADASVYALCLIQSGGETRVLSASASLPGSAPLDHTVRFTTDGADPTATASLYTAPISGAEQLRVSLFVEGRCVATADVRDAAASTRSPAVQTARLEVVPTADAH